MSQLDERSRFFFFFNFDFIFLIGQRGAGVERGEIEAGGEGKEKKNSQNFG